MIKKFFAWVKSLFTKNVEIDDQKVDEYVVNNKPSGAKIYVNGDSNSVRASDWETPLKITVRGENTVITQGPAKESLDVEIPDPAQELVNSRKAVSQAPAKSLDEKLKSVELPAYAKGKVLPPAAKRKFLKQSKSGSSYKASGNSGLRADYVDTTVIGSSLGTVAVASTLLSDAVETRSAECTSSYSSSYGGSDSYSSYDSGSSDCGSCSCD